MDTNSGKQAYDLAQLLWPLNRTLISNDTSKTISILISGFEKYSKVHKFRSGSKFGEWTIPKSWEVKEAYIADKDGSRVIDWKDNNLHLLNYSQSINTFCTNEELKKHLFFDSRAPDWIPYRTSYYENNWGFCVSKRQFDNLNDTNYQVVIESKFIDSELEIGEILIPGKSSAEIVFTTYICHPSMANNELSGPVLLNSIARNLIMKENYYTYRFLFMPETIGSIAYINSNLQSLKKNVIAGFVVTCVGDSKNWSYISSRNGNTLADIIALRVLENLSKNYTKYSFLDRGSDERQFCSPLVDLPFCSITRSKYGTYPEYHTSGDNMDFISATALQESIDYYCHLIAEFELNRVFKPTAICEPMYSRHGLRSPIGAKELDRSSKIFSDIVAFSDATRDTKELSRLLNVSEQIITSHAEELIKKGILQQF